jgi:hypothetical protein
VVEVAVDDVERDAVVDDVVVEASVDEDAMGPIVEDNVVEAAVEDIVVEIVVENVVVVAVVKVVEEDVTVEAVVEDIADVEVPVRLDATPLAFSMVFAALDDETFPVVFAVVLVPRLKSIANVDVVDVSGAGLTT